MLSVFLVAAGYWTTALAGLLTLPLRMLLGNAAFSYLNGVLP